MSAEHYACACCANLTLSEPPGSFAICPVCRWQDDDLQLREPTDAGGANKVSLLDARKNFAAFGASREDFRDRVRAPTPEEAPRK